VPSASYSSQLEFDSQLGAAGPANMRSINHRQDVSFARLALASASFALLLAGCTHESKLHPTGVGGSDGFGPPDDLKNLYNDPEKNAQIPEFNLDVEAPGKADYVFRLTIEGKQPVTTPGAHAFTAIHYARHRGR
jgi:hypothetical protein